MVWMYPSITHSGFRQPPELYDEEFEYDEVDSLAFLGMAYKHSNSMNALDRGGLGVDTTCNASDQENMC